MNLTMNHELKICWTANPKPRLLIARCSCGWQIERFGSNVATLKKNARSAHRSHVEYRARTGAGSPASCS